MTDNEIIKILENEADFDCGICCDNGENCLGEECASLISRAALELINRQKAEIARLQTAVAPVRHVTNRAKYFGETLCPNCGIHLDETTIISKDENEDGDIIHYEFQPNFCANCGARMDGDPDE